MNIGIIGCGWLGLKIAESLRQKHVIYVTTRSKERMLFLEKLNFPTTLVSFDLEEEITAWNILDKLDVIIVTVPFSKRIDSENILEIKFERLTKFIQGFKGQVVFSSSTGVYPSLPRVYIEKDVEPKDNFIEAMVLSYFPQSTILRLAGLMGGDRLLKKYKLSNIEGVVNHIHYVDICVIIHIMISNNIQQEIYNVVAPEHPSKAAVISAQKGEGFEELITINNRIISSEKLIKDLDYIFKYPNPRYFHK